MGVADYNMLYYWREFNLVIFYDSPNHQIKVLAKFSRYTVHPCVLFRIPTHSVVHGYADILWGRCLFCMYMYMHYMTTSV